MSECVSNVFGDSRVLKLLEDSWYGGLEVP